VGFEKEYSENDYRREDPALAQGPVILEFGNAWCGWCRRAQPLIEAALKAHDGVRHIKVADASGKRLGRAFTVKLWPTLVFLKDGEERARLVRPHDADEIRQSLGKIL